MAEQKKGLFARMFYKIAFWVMDYPKRVLSIVFLLSILSIVAIFRLHVNTNLLELLPKESEVTQNILAFNKEEGGANLLQITLLNDASQNSEIQNQTEEEEKKQDPTEKEKKEKERIQTQRSKMLELQKKLEELDTVQYAIYDLDEEIKYQLGLLQFTPTEIEQLSLKVQQGVALGPAAASPLLAQQLFSLGPIADKLTSGSSTRAFVSPENGERIILRPTGSPFDSKFSQRLMKDVYRILEESDLEAANLKIGWIGGPYRHAVEDLELILKDLSKTAGISLLFIFIVVSAGFREVRSIFIIFVPLILGSLWTWGVTGIWVGELNTFTSSFTAILLGLGIDFAIHFYYRFREEKQRQEDIRIAIAETWSHVGPPCLAAGVTSAAGFSALCFASFDGFAQLGFILASGVILCLFAITITLPLMILWRQRQQKEMIFEEVDAGDGKQVTYWMAPYGLGLLFAIAVVASTQLSNIGISYDLSAIRAKGLSYEELEPDVRAVAERAFNPILLTYETPEELATEHLRLQKIIDDETEPYFGNLLSIHSLFPVDVQEREQALQKLSALTTPENLQFFPPQVKQPLMKLIQIPPRKLTPDDVPDGVLHMIGAGTGKNRIVLLPSGNQWDIRENAALSDAIHKEFPTAHKVGEYLATADLYRLLSNDAPLVAGLALVLVLFASMLDIRSLWRALSAVLILVIGMCWAGAAMVFFQINLSIVNFVGIPIMMGIGIDVIIHLMHRISEEGPGRIAYALKTTGKASMVSVATTVVSFSSLLIASSRGIQSLGQLVVTGLILVTLAAFSWIPLGWMSMWFRHSRRKKEISKL